MLRHEKIDALKNEVDQLKVILLRMGNQIKVLNKEIPIGKQSNLEEIVKMVITLLDKPKDSEKARETSKEHPHLINFDQYEFKCQN